MAKKATEGGITLRYRVDKRTKNAIRYAPVVDGPPRVSGNLYVAKWALNGEEAPQEITVTVEGLNLSAQA